jgi:hypothetical protein
MQEGLYHVEVTTARKRREDYIFEYLKQIAKLLSERVGASFLYNQEFDREVQCIIANDGENESSEDEHDMGIGKRMP